MAVLISWFEHYGYAVIFMSLCLEMLALPLPGEMMMSYAGLYVYEGKLNWLMCIAAAGCGVTAGITLSYWIGYRLGHSFVVKYGSRVHLGEEQLARMSVWFEKYGNVLLFIAYFIPGVRHVTGYYCGITRVPFRRYAAFAYSGALFWAALFISLGKVLGPKWEAYHQTVNRYMLIFALGSVLVTLVVYLYRKRRKQLAAWILHMLERGVQTFNSLGTVRVFVVVCFAVFVMFVSLLIGLMQDYGAQEFGQFDEVASYLVHAVFGPEWEGAMHLFELGGTVYFFGPLVALTALFVIRQAQRADRPLELFFLLWVWLGGEALNEVLPPLFHRKGLAAGGLPLLNTFPSEETLTAITAGGFCAFLLVRHYGNAVVRLTAFTAVVALCLIVGISRIYFGSQFPSDVAAGYVFGGCWLSLNILLLEVLRKLRPGAI